MGTDEGRIGILDVGRRYTKFLESQHRSTVYTLVWAPRPGKAEVGASGDGEAPLFLWACADSAVVAHDPHPEAKYKSVGLEDVIAEANGWEKRQKNKKTEFAFSPVMDK